MKTQNIALFEMYVIALREGLDNPVQLAVSKTGGRLSAAVMTAEVLVLEADGGFYLAVTDLALTTGCCYPTKFDIFELVALQEKRQGVAVWYALPAKTEQIPEVSRRWPSTSLA